MTKKPQDISIPSFGSCAIKTKGKTEYVFVHLASWTTSKEADHIEAVGRWLIQAAQYIRDKKSESHRDQ